MGLYTPWLSCVFCQLLTDCNVHKAKYTILHTKCVVVHYDCMMPARMFICNINILILTQDQNSIKALSPMKSAILHPTKSYTYIHTHTHKHTHTHTQTHTYTHANTHTDIDICTYTVHQLCLCCCVNYNYILFFNALSFIDCSVAIVFAPWYINILR